VRLSFASLGEQTAQGYDNACSRQLTTKMQFNLESTWRKLVLVLACVTSGWLGFSSFVNDVTIYNKSPATPSVATHETNPVRVMHGSVRYVTPNQREEYERSQARATWIGAPILIAIALLLLPAKRRGSPNEQGLAPAP
jgi:hypothetical protein